MKNLRAARKLKNLTQKDVAEQLNVTYQTYGRYETGKIKPDPDTIIQLSKLFNVSSDYLLGLIEIPLSYDQTEFLKRIQQEDDPSKIAEEFEVQLGGRTVSGEELMELMKTMQKLDKAVHGDFFKTKGKE